MSVTMESEWRNLYREALMEPDSRQVASRIEEANKAIQRRAMELWYVGMSETSERRDLDTALHFLALLAMTGTAEAEEDEVFDDDRSTYDS